MKIKHEIKKTAAALLIILLCAATLAACGETAPAANEAETAPTAEPTETPAPTPTPVPTPRIELAEGSDIEHTCGRPYTDPGFTAYGSDGEDLTENVEVDGNVLCWKVGEYEVTYRLMQDEEAIAEAQRTVRVVPNELAEEKPAEEKVIYLTFDDGPCTDTAELLDILKAHNAKATFFIVGNHHEEELEILPRIVDEGHALGIHAYRHEYNHLYRRSTEVFFEDFMQAQEIIYKYTGQYATLSRFPGSSRNASWLKEYIPGGYDELTEMMHDMGVRFYDWNVQIEDSATGVSGTISNFKGSIPTAKLPLVVLQHDTRYYSIAALDQMLTWGEENGYVFKALDTTVPEIHFAQDQ